MAPSLQAAEFQQPEGYTPCKGLHTKAGLHALFPQESNNDCLSAALASHVLTYPGASAKSPRSGASVSPDASAKVTADTFPRACAKIPNYPSIKVRVPTFCGGAPRFEAAAG
jgi:hypothetical protein